MWSVPIHYMQGQPRELLWFSRCDVFLLKASSWGRESFGNTEERERPLLEAATNQRLVKTNRLRGLSVSYSDL
jgi:hypothetical protein